MALQQWLGPVQHNGHMNNAKLDDRGVWPERLVAFSNHGWQSFMRAGAPNAGWAVRTHNMVRPTWIDIPYPLWMQPRTPPAYVKPRAQYRRSQPAKKTYALAEALRNSAEAIRAKRG